MRLAIISDIHENIIQLQLALEKIRKLNCDEIICLGDISGFSVPHHNYFDTRNAHECLQLVRENCSFVIAGNHDLHAVRKIPHQSSFNYPENWYELDFQQRTQLSKERVWLYEHEELSPLYTHQDVKYVFDLKEHTTQQYDEHHILFAHYIYPNLTGSERAFYLDAENYTQHQTFMTQSKATLSFSGHRHFGGLFIISRGIIITKKYGRAYNLTKGDIILVPAIAGGRGNSGFCIYDGEKGTAEAVRI